MLVQARITENIGPIRTHACAHGESCDSGLIRIDPNKIALSIVVSTLLEVSGDSEFDL